MTHNADYDAGIVATLTAERVRQGLSMSEVAAVVGGSKSSIHDWEHGVKEPTLGSLRAWADALGYQLALIRVFPPGVPAERLEEARPVVDHHRALLDPDSGRIDNWSDLG